MAGVCNPESRNGGQTHGLGIWVCASGFGVPPR